MSNQEILDALVRHQIYLLRYAGYTRNRVYAILDESEAKIRALIRDGLSGRSVDYRSLEALLKEIRQLRLEYWTRATNFWVQESRDLVKEESLVIDSILLASIPVLFDFRKIDGRLLNSIVSSRPFSGRTLREWIKNLISEDTRRIESVIRAGVVSQEAIERILSRIFGTSALKGADGILALTRRQTDAVIRTAVNFFAHEVRSEFFRANEDVIKKEKFVAVLDSRTTAICRGNDGKVFSINKGPRPPLHIKCRSMRVPFIDSSLGTREANPTTEKMLLNEFTGGKVSRVSDLSRSQVRDFEKYKEKRINELIQDVPSSVSYQQWLKTQSKAFQDEVLGKAKAKLFRDGGLELDQFVNRLGNEMTLKELRDKYPEEFKKAGLI